MNKLLHVLIINHLGSIFHHILSISIHIYTGSKLSMMKSGLGYNLINWMSWLFNLNWEPIIITTWPLKFWNSLHMQSFKVLWTNFSTKMVWSDKDKKWASLELRPQICWSYLCRVHFVFRTMWGNRVFFLV